MVWKKEFSKEEAYSILTAGIIVLIMFPFISTNYMPFIIFNIIGIGIALLIISIGAILVYKASKTTLE